MTKDEALKLALEALESCNWVDDGGYGHAEYDHVSTNKAITAIREALAQPEQEPVALYVYKPTLLRGNLGNVSDGDLPWVYDQDPSSGYSARMLVYTTPPQRKPLPKGEWPKHPSGYVGDVYKAYDKSDLDNYAMQVLAAHGIKE